MDAEEEMLSSSHAIPVTTGTQVGDVDYGNEQLVEQERTSYNTPYSIAGGTYVRNHFHSTSIADTLQL